MFYDFAKYYLEASFIVIAYTVSFIYMAISYVFGFYILPLKKVLRNYELSGDNKYSFIISSFSGTIFFLLTTYCLYNNPSWKFSIIELTIWLILFIGFGYCALYLRAYYHKNGSLFS